MATKKRRERRQREAANAKPLLPKLWAWLVGVYLKIFGGKVQ